MKSGNIDDLYMIYAEDMDGNRRFLGKARANNGGNGLFDLYADECADDEEAAIIRQDGAR